MKKIISAFMSIMLIIFIAHPVLSYAFDTQVIEIYAEDGQVIETVEFNEQDITLPLREAFQITTARSENKQKSIIKIPEGEYITTKNITLSGHTTLDLSDNVTLINSCASSGNIFISPRGIDKYDGLCSFKLIGGTLTYAPENKNGSCLIRLSHCNGIEIKDTKFINGYMSHFVEIAGCKNIVFNNCTFDGFVGNLSSSSSEALQIDILEPTTHFKNMPNYDGTMNNNITVKNCTFTNLLRGIGTRSLFQGYYQNNIKIINNSFSNIVSTAITCMAYTSADISNNIIENCGEGISYYMMRTNSGIKTTNIYDYKGKINTNCKSKICNNTISVNSTRNVSTPTAILVFGNNITSSLKKNNAPQMTVGNYAVYNIQVSNNTISTTGHGIKLYDTKNSKISNNSVTSSKNTNYGIYLTNTSTGNSISSNTITKFSNGIYIASSSNNNDINSNAINNSYSSSIVVNAGCSGENINKNKINNAGKNAMLIYGKCNNIKSNTIVLPALYGIKCEPNSCVTNIGSNKFTSGKNYPIYCDETSSANIYKNTFLSGCSKNFVKGKEKDINFTNLDKPSYTLSKSRRNITLKWTKVNGCTKYKIYRKTGANGKYKQIATVSKKKLTYKDKKLKKGKTYYYKIRAMKKAGSVVGYSDYSSVKKKKI